MSETTPQPDSQPNQPPLMVNIQYIKDLSFEVPNAPAIFASLRTQPLVDLNLDVQARRIQEGQDVFEVVLSIRAEATEPTNNGHTGAVVFIAEMQYAGIFTFNGIPEDSVEAVLLVECPRLLFPFARAILADTTREGGFPPVLLQPVDFVALWQNRRQEPVATV